MFFFFPFYTESKPVSNGGGASARKALPLLPAPRDVGGAPDFGNFGVDLLQKTLALFAASLTALGNSANAFFAQLTASLALDRAARDNANFLGAAWPGFGAPKAQPAPFWPYRPGEYDPMSFSPFLTQGFNPLSINPLAINPWTAFAEGLNFWASLWMLAAPERGRASTFGNKPGALAPVQPFMAKVSTPSGFSWGFSWGA